MPGRAASILSNGGVRLGVLGLRSTTVGRATWASGVGRLVYLAEIDLDAADAVAGERSVRIQPLPAVSLGHP